jgi:hypothetical protein
MAMVEALPATTQKSLITLTAARCLTGQPVLGLSRITVRVHAKMGNSDHNHAHDNFAL